VAGCGLELFFKASVRAKARENLKKFMDKKE